MSTKPILSFDYFPALSGPHWTCKCRWFRNFANFFFHHQKNKIFDKNFANRKNCSQIHSERVCIQNNRKNQFLAVEKLKNENLRRFWPYAVTWEEGFSVARNGAHRYDGLSGVGNICHSAPNFWWILANIGATSCWLMILFLIFLIFLPVIA